MDESHTKSSQSRSPDRKTTEKNRRIQMKALYSELNSLLPHHSSREPLTLPDQLDEATKYIKKLQVNVEKKRKAFEKLNTIGSSSVDVFMPKIEIQETGLMLHIFLVTSLEHRFMFNEIIRILSDELRGEITHAGYSTVNDAVLHTLHYKVEECEYGGDRSMIFERLEKFVSSVNY